MCPSQRVLTAYPNWYVHDGIRKGIARIWKTTVILARAIGWAELATTCIGNRSYMP